MRRAAILPDAPALAYDANCRRCPRLAGFLDTVRADNPDYWCRRSRRSAIPGLAGHRRPRARPARRQRERPAVHRRLRGILLYETLYDFGYASSPISRTAADRITLTGCRITNAVKCLPPQNKPLPAEVANCNGYLAADLAALPARWRRARARAHRARRDARSTRVCAAPRTLRAPARHALPPARRCSTATTAAATNTNTGRLTRAMFRDVFADIAAHLGRPVVEAA
jgi:hypothetical protein